MKRLILAALLAVANTSVNSGTAENTYLCVTDYTTGFAYNKVQKKWLPTNFDVVEKYLIRPLTSVGIRDYIQDRIESDTSHVLVEFGKGETFFEIASTQCRVEEKLSTIYCKGVYDVRFDLGTLSFQLYYAAPGYVTFKSMRERRKFNKQVGFPEDYAGDTPYLAIGKCSKV